SVSLYKCGIQKARPKCLSEADVSILRYRWCEYTSVYDRMGESLTHFLVLWLHYVRKWDGTSYSIHNYVCDPIQTVKASPKQSSQLAMHYTCRQYGHRTLLRIR